MTRQADFKARIRERMARTGERYVTARSALIARSERNGNGVAPPTIAADLQLVPGYAFGGVCPETGVMTNVLRSAGITDPATGQAWDEAVVFGLAGGIGFMAFVFRYAGHSPMFTTVLRSDAYPEAFVLRGLQRIANVEGHQTGSAQQAATRLEAVLAEGRPAICTVDVASLGYLGIPVEYAGYGPREVAVAGRSPDGALLAIDDRAVRPIVCESSRFAAARAAYRKGRHRMLTVSAGSRLDPAEIALESIRGTVRGFRESPVKGFAPNFGIAGLERWARLVGDRKDPKGWPRLLADGEAFASVMAQLYNGIELEHTPPGGGRPFYARFLAWAAAITERPALGEVAARYRELGTAWSGLADVALDPSDAARLRLRESLESRLRLVDELGADAAGPARVAWETRLELQRGCTIGEEDRMAILDDLAGRAAAIAAGEREALAALESAVR
jgi:hypothetical protein